MGSISGRLEAVSGGIERSFRRAFGLALLLAVLTAPSARSAPFVLETSPLDQQTAVPLASKITIKVDVPLNPTTVTGETVLVTSNLRGTLPGSVVWLGSDNRIRFAPFQFFRPGERIAVTLTKGIRDLSGEPLVNGHHIQFTTWTAAVPRGQFVTSAESWSIGEIALNLSVGDLDGDQLPEVIFSNVVPDSLTILTPDGADAFAPFAQLPTGILPRHTALGDVDGNGFLDLVCCASGPNEIDVFLNQGGGVFAPAQSYTTGQTPYGAFIGDLDADGDLDVATANFNGHSISVLLNEGDGAFGVFTDYSAGIDADSPRWVDGADFDGDGDIDLACCNGYSDDVSIFLNDGSGVFAVQSPLIPVEESPNFMEARDLDGDRIVDLVTVNAGPGSISVLSGNGDGTFDPATHFSVGGTLPFGLQVVDVDGDADLDVLVPIRGSNSWRILWNDGNGDFEMGEAYFGGVHCHSIGAADWDFDGDIDVVSGFAQSEEMYFYRSVATPAVTSTFPIVHETGASLSSTVVLTFNTALDPETLTASALRVVGSQSGPHRSTIVWSPSEQKVQLTPHSRFAAGEIVTVTVDGTGLVESLEGVEHEGFAFEFMAQGAEALPAFQHVTIGLPGADPLAIAAADFDGDDSSDLVVANFLSANVTLLLTGGGDLPALTTNLPTAVSPFDLWTGDLDGNEEVDIAVATLSSTINVLRNQGGGFFQPSPPIPATGAPFGITGGDFDLDGDLDVAVCEIDPDQIVVHWNDGAGGFPSCTVLPCSGTPLDIVRVDLDRDGDLDLVTANSAVNTLQIFLNDLLGPSASFLSGGTLTTGDAPVNVLAWDATGDGWIDLVSTDFDGGGISIFVHLGQGASFAPALPLASGSLPHGIAGVDLTGNSAIDLVVPNSGGSTVTLFRNSGDGAFDEFADLGVGNAPYATSGADWNGDGIVDLAIVNRTSGNLTLLVNGQQSTGAEVESPTGPVTSLLGASPNPFREAVSIHLALGQRQEVSVRVFDLRGRAVATIHDGPLAAGIHRLSWDGSDRGGARVAAGVYFVRMDAEDRSWTRKLLRLQ